MRIRINTDINAPSCPCEIEGLDENGNVVDTILVQTDWDFPGFASSFGWSVKQVQVIDDRVCDHDGTDGTVKCNKCGCEPGQFINSAYDFLASNDGLEVEDSGYFS